MTLLELKKSIHDKIDHLTDEALLERIDAIIENGNDKIFQIPEEHLPGILQGELDIKNGDYLTLEEMKKRYEKWLND
jgi:hypothetical protein